MLVLEDLDHAMPHVSDAQEQVRENQLASFFFFGGLRGGGGGGGGGEGEGGGMMGELYRYFVPFIPRPHVRRKERAK